MVFIVGLGNPGKEYATTRHNIGWLVLDQVATQLGAPPFTFQKKFQVEMTKVGPYLLVKPQTFMNASGQAVRAVLDFYGQVPGTPEADFPDLAVIHDDLDIVLGQYKLQFGRGPKVHNGLLSIYQHLHTHQFWHARVGVDSRGGDRTVPGSDYVLQGMNSQEQAEVTQLSHQISQDLIQKLTAQS